MLSLLFITGLELSKPVTANDGAYLSGYVYDEYNNPLNDVTLTLGEQSFTTKDDGFYFFDHTSVGELTINLEYKDITNEFAIELEPGKYYERVLVLQDTSTADSAPAGGGAGGNIAGSIAGVLGQSEILKTNPTIIRNIGINSYGSLSPVENLLAVEVLARSTDSYDIWLIKPDGEKIKEAVSLPGNDENPRWSPDGSKLVFHRREPKKSYEIWIVDLKTDQTMFIDYGLTPAWSVDGSSLVYGKYLNNNWDIYKFNLDTEQAERLTKHQAKEQYPYWGVINGEEKILFASKRTGTYEIWVMDTNGSNQQRLSNSGERTGNRMIGPVLSPDGLKIAYWEIDYVNDHSVWVMDVDGNAEKEILTRAANPEWGRTISPKLTELFFDSKISGRAQIWKTDLRY